MSEQANQTLRRQHQLRNTGIVALIVGVLCNGFGAFYPALSVVGVIAVVIGVVLLVAWLIIRSQRR